MSEPTPNNAGASQTGHQSGKKFSGANSLAFMLLSISFAICASAALYVISSPQLRQLSRYQSTLAAVLSEYPDKINTDDLFKNSSDEVYKVLDRYSRFAPAQSYTQVVEEYSGAYAGVGVSIVSQPNGLLIASVNPDGPAKEAGIKLGDVIISADTVDLTGKTTQQASNILRGKEGDTVTVGFIRPHPQTTLAVSKKGDLASRELSDTIFTDIVRAAVPLRHVTLYGVTPSQALYVRLNDFGSGAAKQFKHALDSLREAHPDNQGILIDLRNNPGGLLSEALDLADYFLPDNTLLLGEKGKSRWSRREFYSWSDDQTDGAPVVIMVNRFSASASEVFSGALKYAGRATLIGDTTFGKGLIQEYHSFNDGSASKLTVGRYYFTGERYLNQPGAEKVDSGSGLPPDVLHQFGASKPLLRALGAQLLFTKFVARYQDIIISAYEQDKYDDIVSEFHHLVSQTGFDFRSKLLQRANALYLWASLYESDPQSLSISSAILRKAEKLEGDLFELQRDKIIRRLAQLSYERRDGAKEAFLKITLPNDPDINVSASLLIDTNQVAGQNKEAGA